LKEINIFNNKREYMEDLHDGLYDEEAFVAAILMGDRTTKTIKMVDGTPKHVTGTLEQWIRYHTETKKIWNPFNEWARKVDETRQK
jgi:hypothetical protein